MFKTGTLFLDKFSTKEFQYIQCVYKIANNKAYLYNFTTNSYDHCNISTLEYDVRRGVTEILYTPKDE